MVGMVVLIHPTIDPRACSPPLGLLTMAACLERTGFLVRVIDCQVEILSLSEVLALDPLCIGIYASTPTFPKAIEIVKEIRAFASVPIVMGGPHPSFLDREILEAVPELDYIIRFESEEAMVHLVKDLQNHQLSRTIPNLTYRVGDVVCRTDLAPPLKPLDELPFPARHLVDMSKYPAVTGGAFITSRGCSYKCAFCASTFFHRELRARSPEKVLIEIEDSCSRYGLRFITFFDDLFAFNRERTIDLCTRLQEADLALQWGCETRIDTVDPELLKIMYDAGCRYIFFGTESGQETTLKTIGKRLRTQAVHDVVKAARDQGITVKTSLMIGLPTDTHDMVLRSIDFFQEIQPDYLAALIATPYPGTPIWTHPEKFDVVVIDHDLSHYDYKHVIMETSHLKAENIWDLYLETLAFNMEHSPLDLVR